MPNQGLKRSPIIENRIIYKVSSSKKIINRRMKLTNLL
jgi:hypothetical protein